MHQQSATRTVRWGRVGGKGSTAWHPGEVARRRIGLIESFRFAYKPGLGTTSSGTDADGLVPIFAAVWYWIRGVPVDEKPGAEEEATSS